MQKQKLSCSNSRSITIIIEWENVRLAELQRCQRMLRQLNLQMRKLNANLAPSSQPYAFEVLILFNRDAVAESQVRTVVESCLDRVQPNLLLKIVPVEDAPYYEQKNIGAQQAAGDVLVFLDSDVIPDDGWLEHLLASFDSAGVHVVGGDCYIDPESFYAKAFALFWFFPLRKAHGELYVMPHFFANNVAFRTETFRKYGFPTSRDTSRGACVHLAEALKADGIAVYRNSKCQVSHPAPNGLSHFVRRGVAEGRDRWLALKSSRPDKASILRATLRFLKSSSRGIRSTFRFRRDVGVSLAGAPCAAVIAVTYQSLCFAGEVLTWMYPGYMKSHFHV